MKYGIVVTGIAVLIIALTVPNATQRIEIHTKHGSRPVYSERVKRQLSEGGLLEIFGDSDQLNYYFVNIYLGANRQKASLIIDTGSSIMCTTCKQTCTSCGSHENPHYDSSESETFNLIDCKSEKCSPFPNNKSCSEDKCAFNIVIVFN